MTSETKKIFRPQRNNENKIVLLGESSIGKTSLSYRLANNTFKQDYGSTIGAAFNCFRYKDIKLDLWDTAGQERYVSIAPVYYRKAKIILLVFDMSNTDTLDRVSYYLELLTTDMMHDFQCIIIGNKSDLISEDERDKLIEEVKLICEPYSNQLSRPLDYISISAKDNNNILELKEKIYNYSKDIMSYEALRDHRFDNQIYLNNNDNNNDNYSRCC